MEKWLDLTAAIFAAIAALFWFLSAEAVPQMVMYWGAAPPNDPFFMSVQASAHWNSLAAAFSGFAAAFMAAAAAHRIKA